MQVDILNKEGNKTGRSIELPADIFGIEPNDHVIYLSVKQFLAAQRQGTHKVKTRAEVKGASRKLHRQKGTGGSRKGNIRNPLYKGGGTVFGPKPHGYDFKLNRKVKDLAKMSALSYKAKENAIVVVEDINFETPKTKEFVAVLNNLSVDTKALVVTNGVDEKVALSARNIPGVTVVEAEGLNVLDVVSHNKLILTKSAVEKVEEVLA